MLSNNYDVHVIFAYLHTNHKFSCTLLLTTPVRKNVNILNKIGMKKPVGIFSQTTITACFPGNSKIILSTW